VNFVKARPLAILVAAVSLHVLLAAGARADDSDEIRPRGYKDLDRPEMKSSKSGVAEITVNYPEEADAFVKFVKMQLLKQHHKGSFKKTGELWTVKDETANKTWILRSRHTNAKRKTDIRGLQAAAQLYPKNVSILSMVSITCDEQKNWPLALEYYRKAFDPRPSPTSPEDLVLAGDSNTERSQIAANCAYFELMMGHYQTAVNLLNKAIELEPLYGVNYKNRAAAYRKLHKPDLAAQDEKKLQQLQSTKTLKATTISRSDTRKSLSLFYAHMGMYDQAIKMADQMLAKVPKSGLAHLARARSLVGVGRYEQALPDYKAVLEATQNAPSVKAEMAVAERLAKQGPPPYGDLSLLKDSADAPLPKYPVIKDGKTAAVSVAQLAADHKGDLRVYSTICHILKKKSMLQPLVVELGKVLTIHPDSSNSVAMKIEVEEALRHWSEAEKYCNRYMTLLASDSVDEVKLDFLEYLYTVRALARRAQNNCPGAIDDATTVLKLAPESAQAFCDRGDCYMQCGKYDLAMADYTKSIQFDDTNTGGIYLRRARAYDKLKKSDLAKKDRDTAANLKAGTAGPQARPD
jgi:tetratricopeptide (TPR) repeat protein